MPDNLVCVARITSSHGVRGSVKIKSFTEDPYSIEEYSPLYSKDGSREFSIKIISGNDDMLIARVEGVDDRNQADLLRNIELYADKELFPPVDEDEFFYEDLAGLRVKTESGKEFGKILSVHDYGGGDMVEINISNTIDKTEFFAFTKEIFPIVNVGSGFVVICPPEVESTDDV